MTDIATLSVKITADAKGLDAALKRAQKDLDAFNKRAGQAAASLKPPPGGGPATAGPGPDHVILTDYCVDVRVGRGERPGAPGFAAFRAGPGRPAGLDERPGQNPNDRGTRVARRVGARARGAAPRAEQPRRAHPPRARRSTGASRRGPEHGPRGGG